jgi:peptidoglycan hydrolase-like protein with peptidoglycan-binding domain
MSRQTSCTWVSAPRRALVVVAGLSVLIAACGSSNGSSSTSGGSTTTEDPLAAAQTRVSTAEVNVADAQDALSAAGEKACTDAETYVAALDRYGKLFTDDKATVGDVQTAGADLTEPRDVVSASITAVSTAQSDLAGAQAELADAQAALVAAQAAASSVPTSAAPPPASTTTTTLVPAATVARVKQAEDDLAATAEGITASTPLVEATVEFHSAAFALEISWLKLLSDAGCLTDEQQAKAAAQVADYTVALQTQLQTAGYYQGPIDGIYGPQTVAAVEQLQTDSGLAATGLVDQATARALDDKLSALGATAAQQAMIQTSALQTVLKLTGHWTGPIDGQWTPELTDALKAFQTALGVEPTGAVDAATLAAFQLALANLKAIVTTTTTTTTTTTSTTTTTTEPTTATEPTTT